MSNIVIKANVFSEGLAETKDAEHPLAPRPFRFAQNFAQKATTNINQKSLPDLTVSILTRRQSKPENRRMTRFPTFIFLKLCVFSQMTQRQV